MPNPLTLRAHNDWKSSCELLNDSLRRYKPYDRYKKYTAAELEFYDSLSFRYTKAIETAFYFFRALESEMAGQPSEFLRDQLLKMEKLGIVGSTDAWMDARRLRNKITHSYDPDELEAIFADLILYAHQIVESLQHAQQHLK